MKRKKKAAAPAAAKRKVGPWIRKKVAQRKSPSAGHAAAPRKGKKKPLFGFTDESGNFHPLRNSPGYRSSMTTNPTPDRTSDAIEAAIREHNLAKMSESKLVALHNRIAKKKRKTFSQLALMRASKICALAKGAQVQRV